MPSQAQRKVVDVIVHAYGDVWASVVDSLRQRNLSGYCALVVHLREPQLQDGLAVAWLHPDRINVVACDQIHVTQGREGLLGRNVRSIGITGSKAVAYALLAAQWEGVVLDGHTADDWKLTEVINTVSQGAKWVSLEVRAPPGDPGIRSLTKKEWTIAILLTDGFSAPQIQSALGLSYGTIASHRANIYHKTGSHSAVDLRKCMEQVGFSIAPAAVRRALQEEVHAIMAPDKDPLPGDAVAQCGK